MPSHWVFRLITQLYRAIVATKRKHALLYGERLGIKKQIPLVSLSPSASAEHVRLRGCRRLERQSQKSHLHENRPLGTYETCLTERDT